MRRCQNGGGAGGQSVLVHPHGVQGDADAEGGFVKPAAVVGFEVAVLVLVQVFQAFHLLARKPAIFIGIKVREFLFELFGRFRIGWLWRWLFFGLLFFDQDGA